MLRVPPEGHAVRNLVDVQQVLTLTPDSVETLPTVPEARATSRAFFRDRKTPALSRQYGDVSEIFNILVRANDGRVILVGFGPRGSFKLRWNFGRVEGVPSYLKVPAEITAAAHLIVETTHPNDVID